MGAWGQGRECKEFAASCPDTHVPGALPSSRPACLTVLPACLGGFVIGMINLPAQLASSNQSLVFGCNLSPSGRREGLEGQWRRGSKLCSVPNTASEREGAFFELISLLSPPPTPPSTLLPTPTPTLAASLLCFCLGFCLSL